MKILKNVYTTQCLNLMLNMKHRILYINSLSACVYDHWTQRKVTVDAEKSDGKKIRRP